MLLRERCQAQNTIADAGPERRLLRRLHYGPGLRTAVRNSLRLDPPRVAYGAPSAFPVGARVRVKSQANIRAVLDGALKTRGLQWVEQQWSTCDQTYMVARHVRRIMDDDGVMRAIYRSVSLAGVNCDLLAPGGGCGRVCPLFFRDEWLELVEQSINLLDSVQAHYATPIGYARVKSIGAIRATLDLGGGRDGVMFMPEMYRYADERWPVLKRVKSAHEMGRDWPVKVPVYVLEGPGCGGAILGRRGPCDRGCAFLWHRDWIELESEI